MAKAEIGGKKRKHVEAIIMKRRILLPYPRDIISDGKEGKGGLILHGRLVRPDPGENIRSAVKGQSA
jgi:hypothetical protein